MLLPNLSASCQRSRISVDSYLRLGLHDSSMWVLLCRVVWKPNAGVKKNDPRTDSRIWNCTGPDGVTGKPA